MSAGQGGWGIPGVGANRSTYESQLLWGADHARNGLLWQGQVVSGATRDAGNTPTTHLRPGLLMGRLTSSGELEEWDADAADGTQNLAGVLDIELRAQDYDGVDQDRVFAVIVARAPIKARKLLIQGAAFVGHADEYLARQQLAMAGFVFDDDPFNYLSGLNQRVTRVTAAGATALTASQNGSLIIFSNAAAVAATLPAIQPGLSFDLLREGDEEMVVSSAEGDNMIFGNDLEGDSITFTAAGNHIGARVRVKSIYVNGVLKWLPEHPFTFIGTGLNTVTFALAT